ncbi:MAG: OmpA family protein [Candidatus Zixiibacteriota bacterium]|nr:MAG: OmpA family protein [candidate division Zixibacteria bacterium]
MADEEQQPIIIVKKSGGRGGHHGGSWKVAYADFVTALMAFFLVMWLVNQEQAVKDAVQGYFNDPVNFGKKEGSSSVLPGGASIFDSDVPPPKQPTGEEGLKEVLEKAGNQLQMELAKIPGFDAIKEHVHVEMIPEGLRIQLIEASSTDDNSSYFFDLGSAKLSDKGIQILTVIGQELGNLDNKIVVEGHTDSKQYHYNDRYSNWELSADRANSARKLLQEKEIESGQIYAIRGYADNSPMITDNPADARNRRIAIVVLARDPGEVSREIAISD